MTSHSAPEYQPFYQPLIDNLADFFLFWGQIASLGLEAFWFILRGQVSVRGTVKQMGEVGVGSLIVAMLTVGFSGAVAALYLAAQLVLYGQAGLAGGIVGKSLALEIAPVITAIVVAARSGSAMAAELGSMTVTEQVDALRTMGASPVRYLGRAATDGHRHHDAHHHRVRKFGRTLWRQPDFGAGRSFGHPVLALVSGLCARFRYVHGFAQVHPVRTFDRFNRLPPGTEHAQRRAGRRFWRQLRRSCSG